MLKESALPSRRLRTWILHLVQPQNTDIIYEGNHHQPWSEPCLPAPSSWPPTVFFVFQTEGLCGLKQQGFNQHMSVYFYICYKVSIYVIVPPAMFNDLQDVHFPRHPRLCYYVPFLCRFSPQQFDEDLTSSFTPRLSLCLHCVVDEAVKETVSGQVMRRDKGDDLPQSVSPAAAGKVRMCVCVTRVCKSVWWKPQVLAFI